MGELVSIPLEGNPLGTYLSTLDSNESRRTMATCVRNIQGILHHALYSMVPAEVGMVRNTLRQTYRPATRNKHMSALRGYLRVAHRMGMVGDLVMRELAEAKNFKSAQGLSGRMIQQAEIDAMISVCPQEEALGARDGALLAVLRAGLRRAEAVGLDLEDLSFADNRLRVLGKGEKERLVPLPLGARRLLLCWLVHRGTEAGPLLGRTDVLPRLERLSTQTVADRVAALWQRSGGALDATPTPHDFRRTLATELLDNAQNPKVAQEILGHAMLETTVRYDRGPEERKAKAMALVKVEQKQ